jgi:D-citramalate synthase
VFTQVAGVHADGDKKKNLYHNDLVPERFGRSREYALGKNSGKANILKNLEALGIEVDDEAAKKVTARIIELGDKKELVSPDELPYIVSDILKNGIDNQEIQILNYSLNLTDGMRPTATVKISIRGEVYQQSAAGDGQYHAFSKAMYKIYKSLNKPTPELLDYVVVIPPGGKTNAYVQTIITWRFDGKIFKTRGLDVDQTAAAIKATIKMLNMIEKGNIPVIRHMELP